MNDSYHKKNFLARIRNTLIQSATALHVLFIDDVMVFTCQEKREGLKDTGYNQVAIRDEKS